MTDNTTNGRRFPARRTLSLFAAAAPASPAGPTHAGLTPSQLRRIVHDLIG
jgi:hypothetical protein